MLVPGLLLGRPSGSKPLLALALTAQLKEEEEVSGSGKLGKRWGEGGFDWNTYSVSFSSIFLGRGLRPLLPTEHSWRTGQTTENKGAPIYNIIPMNDMVHRPL